MNRFTSFCVALVVAVALAGGSYFGTHEWSARAADRPAHGAAALSARGGGFVEGISLRA